MEDERGSDDHVRERGEREPENDNDAELVEVNEVRDNPARDRCSDARHYCIRITFYISVRKSGGGRKDARIWTVEQKTMMIVRKMFDTSNLTGAAPGAGQIRSEVTAREWKAHLSMRRRAGRRKR